MCVTLFTKITVSCTPSSVTTVKNEVTTVYTVLTGRIENAVFDVNPTIKCAETY